MNLYQTVPEKKISFLERKETTWKLIKDVQFEYGPLSNPCEPIVICNTARRKSVTVSNDCLTWVDARDAIATSHVP